MHDDHAAEPTTAPLRIAVVVTSDRCAAGWCQDRSGALLFDLCRGEGFEPDSPVIVPDEVDRIAEALVTAIDSGGADIVFTVGGTGLGPRDVTPEATRRIAEREVPGIGEAIRSASVSVVPRAMLSRGIAAVRKGALIINLPGSPGGVRDGFRVTAPILVHARQMMDGMGHE